MDYTIPFIQILFGLHVAVLIASVGLLEEIFAINGYVDSFGTLFGKWSRICSVIVTTTVFDRMSARGAQLILGARGRPYFERGAY